MVQHSTRSADADVRTNGTHVFCDGRVLLHELYHAVRQLHGEHKTRSVNAEEFHHGIMLLFTSPLRRKAELFGA